jgi:hypothetical protein
VRRTIVAVLTVAVLGGSAEAAGDRPSTYRKTGGPSQVERIRTRHCSAEDSWSVVHLVEFTGTKAVLSCRGRY